MFTINDKSMNMQRIDETVRLGDTEIWAITNEADMAHPKTSFRKNSDSPRQNGFLALMSLCRFHCQQ
jgi:hypothetical protein